MTAQKYKFSKGQFVVEYHFTPHLIAKEPKAQIFYRKFKIYKRKKGKNGQENCYAGEKSYFWKYESSIFTEEEFLAKILKDTIKSLEGDKNDK